MLRVAWRLRDANHRGAAEYLGAGCNGFAIVAICGRPWVTILDNANSVVGRRVRRGFRTNCHARWRGKGGAASFLSSSSVDVGVAGVGVVDVGVVVVVGVDIVSPMCSSRTGRAANICAFHIWRSVAGFGVIPIIFDEKFFTCECSEE
jgi:hypothetical protein